LNDRRGKSSVHTHRAFELVVGDGKRILNPGSVLRSRAEGDPPATGTFGVLEVPSLRFRVCARAIARR